MSSGSLHFETQLAVYIVADLDSGPFFANTDVCLLLRLPCTELDEHIWMKLDLHTFWRSRDGAEGIVHLTE